MLDQVHLPFHHADSGGGDRKRRRIDEDDCAKTEMNNDCSKGADSPPGETSDAGPTIPLPHKMVLVFILDKLQKKDTYGVFSEPVDPEELPDYHEVIEHPMDFGTVRKKLADGAYKYLEEFEKDIFLISSNAMCYNAPNTVYYRQARSIHELAKKNFENLRQERNDNEPGSEPVVRRGRPPTKNKEATARPADCAASDFSADVTLAIAGNGSHMSDITHGISGRVSSEDKSSIADMSTRASCGLHSSDAFGGMIEQKAEKIEENSGSAVKGTSAKCVKKHTAIDESRRNTYKQYYTLAYDYKPPIFISLNGEKKQLIPVKKILHLPLEGVQESAV